MSFERRYAVIIPLFLVLCALLGGFFGPGAQSVSAAAVKNSDEDVNASISSFTKIYDIVEQNFADKLSADKGIYKGAIPGMLRTLDPHSNFLDPKDMAGFREEQHGRYFGVGMMIGVQPRTGKTMVITPFGGAPAYEAGIRPGDVILEVNDKRVDNLSTPEIADMLKGPRGTQVQVVVAREGVAKPITFNLTRNEIRRNNVDAAFFLKPGIAYIDILSFNSETTSKEVEDALKRLGEQSIQGLVVDLRGNGGGILQEGVAIAGRWLDRGQTVVSHKGRSYAEKPYLARGSQFAHNYPIVVLVDRGSASASEIVAGALQDHDRAWILGDVTFGKGLVQSVYPLSDNTGLLLTTQHYYTPSGRLIQRDYSSISFLDYYYGKRAETKDPMDVKMTDGGRTVYGGGGITPDEKYVAPKLNPFQIELLRKRGAFTFTSHYFGGKEAKLPKGWAPDEQTLNEYHAFLLKQGVQFTEADWTANHDWLKRNLKKEMYTTAFSFEDARRVEVEDDPEVAKAVEAIPQARALLDNMKKQQTVQRASR